jgi:peroxiredoxin
MARPASRADHASVLRARLSVGDIAPACRLLDLDGAVVDLLGDAIAGNPIAIVFCPRVTPSVSEALAGYCSAFRAMTNSGARIFAVTREQAGSSATQNLPFPVLFDGAGEVFRAFTVEVGDHPTTVVLRPNHHVASIIKSSGKRQAAEALAVVERLAAERKPVQMGAHPPVLIVPEVLTRPECRHLVSVFETRGNVFMPPGPGIDYIGKDYKMRIPEHGRRDRVDHWIVEEDTKEFIRHRLQTRLFPEIAKAFHYDVTVWERMRIGCYQGERGGKLHGHRDNVEPTPYRRFAMSMNLNVEEFTGGELRFPEFGDQRYRPDNGAAFVFSSSLLHEALHVASGRRLVLLAFLFGDR